MALLEKTDTLFLRDENNNLLPQEVVLETLKVDDGNKPTIMVIPLKKGELQRVVAESKSKDTSKSQDDELILKHCHTPKYTESEIESMQPKFADAIVKAIFAISTGWEQSKFNSNKKEVLNKAMKEVQSKKE